MADSDNKIEIFNRVRRRKIRDRAFDRAGGGDFLNTLLAEEALERLSLVNRDFGKCLLVGLPATPLKNMLIKRGISSIVADAGFGVTASLDGVQCDEDRLPFADQSFDLIIQIGTLDSVNDLPGALALARRILRPDGLFLSSFVGAESLRVLKSTLMEAEEDQVSSHIHPQIDVRTIGDLMTRTGFAMPVADSDTIRLRYSEFSHLIRDLRDFGGGNILQGQVPRISRSVYKKANEIFLKNADERGKTVECVELISLSGWAPHPDQSRPARRGSGQMSLKNALEKKPIA